MSELIFGHDRELADWAGSLIPHVGAAGFGPCKAIGVADGDKLWAAVVYHGWIESYGICEVSIAAANPRWATKGHIRALLSVPFEQYRCRKVYGTIPIDNERACKLIKGLGFTPEGVLRHHYAPKRHARLFSMMNHEYRKKWSAEHGQKVALAAASA